MTYHVKIYGLRGDCLLQTWNKGEHSRDMEIDAALSRSDVSRVDWWGDGTGRTWKGEPDLAPLTSVFPTRKKSSK